MDKKAQQKAGLPQSHEKAKRLAPSGEVLRELFLKSGNMCAFPACNKLMMNRQGQFIGQVCHIEAAEEGGERFNPKMTNEDRRSAGNLMLMCYEHHKETDDMTSYSVDSLKKIKQEHEERFSHPARAMLEELKDWTTHEAPTLPTTLAKMHEAVGYKLTSQELEETLPDLLDFIARLKRVPATTRKFLGLVAQRAEFAGKSAIGASGTEILLSDVRAALGLSVSSIKEHLEISESHGFAYHDRNNDLQDVIVLSDLRSGWPLWADLVAFSEKSKIPLERFTVELRFNLLD